MIVLTLVALLLALLFPSWKMGFRQANGDWLSIENLDLRDVRAFLFTGPSSQIVPRVSISSAFPVRFGWRLNVGRLLIESSAILLGGLILLWVTRSNRQV